MFMNTLDNPKKRHRGDAMKTKVPTDPELRWEWIKYQLRVRGSSLAQVAQELSVGRNAANNVKRVRYPRIERAIARKLDMAPRNIWPDRWNPDGSPKRDRPNAGEIKHANNVQDTKSNAIAHCQMARSA